MTSVAGQLREFLIPHEKIFFELLERESKNVLAGALALDDLVRNFRQLADRRNQFKDIEHQGDNIDPSIWDRLIRTFITPIARRDIGKQASLNDKYLA